MDRQQVQALDCAGVTVLVEAWRTMGLGQIALGAPGVAFLPRLTKVPGHLNPFVAKLKLLPLFAAPPKWAAFPFGHLYSKPTRLFA